MYYTKGSNTEIRTFIGNALFSCNNNNNNNTFTVHYDFFIKWTHIDGKIYQSVHYFHVCFFYSMFTSVFFHIVLTNLEIVRLGKMKTVSLKITIYP